MSLTWERVVADKLGRDEVFPRIVLDLADGSAVELPQGLERKYNIVLFFRGHW